MGERAWQDAGQRSSFAGMSACRFPFVVLLITTNGVSLGKNERGVRGRDVKTTAPTSSREVAAGIAGQPRYHIKREEKRSGKGVKLELGIEA